MSRKNKYIESKLNLVMLIACSESVIYQDVSEDLKDKQESLIRPSIYVIINFLMSSSLWYCLLSCKKLDLSFANL
jgi:tyrosine-protein phosphatase YwqE